jgi:hypothetical protein
MRLREYLLAELYKPKDLANFKKDIKPFTKVDSRDSSWAMKLPEYFAKYGFEFLGSGKYGSVFGNPRYPFIIKVFMKDAAYMKWIEFCNRNKNNPYCPKFKGKVIKISDNFFAIRVEKLTPTVSSAYKEFSLALKTGEADYDKDLKTVVDFLNDNKSLLDMHSENVMMRGNQLVVIDPFYNWFNTATMKYTIDPDKVDLKNLI